ncbi:MAG: UDP-glucose 4-epimerase GalE [Coriobacteriales bacterium]|jgi:UDP-glucose 4-epimerase|nr:UDP-glucose 4-epimerase GalE [Coriobacteriales bacterium]
MQVLVAGGAGYIGSHAVYQLIRAGHGVIVYDNLSTGQREAVHPEARFVQADIRDQTALETVFAQEAAAGRPVEVAMHFAAKLIVPESLTQPLAYYQNNVEGLRTMLAAMVERGVPNIVFSSTAAVYGEPISPVCLEDSPTLPINPYGETKLACERMIRWVCAAHGMNYAIFRYFNVAGADSSLQIGLNKDQLTHLIPLIMQSALGLRERLEIYGNDYDTPDGTCIRDYIHVSDLAQAHVLGAEYLTQNKGSLLANLGSGHGYSVSEVVAAAERMFSFKWGFAPRRAGDPAKLTADISRARELLGWQPQLSLEQMLRSDYDYRRKISEG